MALVWNWVGAFGVFTGIVMWLAAWVIFAARPDRSQNKLLALMLLVSGAARASGLGFIYLTDDPASAYAWQWINVHTFLWTSIATLAFIGTIPTPIARPLASPAARIVLLAFAIGASLFMMFVGGDRVVSGVARGSWSAWDGVGGPWLIPIRLASWVAPLLSLIVAIAGITTSERGSAQRGRASAYAWAFGVRDIGLVAVLFWFAFLPPTGPSFLAFVASFSVLDLLFAGLLALGILRTQLFDIDIKLKWTIKRGTVAGALITAFIVASQVAQEFFTDELGWAVGGVAAGALLLAFRPLERAADRLANAAMPGVGSDAEYEAFRKIEVYKGALEEMLEDGTLTQRDRKLLDGIRRRLHLSPDTAAKIERDVTAGSSAAPGA